MANISRDQDVSWVFLVKIPKEKFYEILVVQTYTDLRVECGAPSAKTSKTIHIMISFDLSHQANSVGRA